MSAPAPITTNVRHAVPLLVRSARGGRPSLAEDAAETAVTIPGVAKGSFLDHDLNQGLFSRTVLRHGDRLWEPVTVRDTRTNAHRPMPLDLALDELARGWRARDADGADTSFDGLAGAPLAMMALPSLRHAPHGADLPPRIPPEAMETGHALARRAMAAFAARDLRHDGGTLYRAVTIPLLYPRPRISTNAVARFTFGEPGILAHRLGSDGRFPHSPRCERDEPNYGSTVRELHRVLSRSLRGIEHGDRDLVEFANETATGLVVLLRSMAGADAGLRRLADGLWPLVAAGSVDGIQGDDLLPATETIRAAADTMLAAARPGKTPAILGSIVAFADEVALPLLRDRAPVPETDAETLSALAP